MILAPDNAVILNPNGRLAAFEALENNWYEATRPSVARSFIPYYPQDPVKDLDRFTRLELIKKARYLYKNSPLIRGLIERIVTLTVGIGFTPVFKSSNREWNKRAKAVWKKKSRNVNLGPRASMLQYQRAVGRARFLDGMCASIKTEESEVSFEPRVQGIEAERITSAKQQKRPGGKDPIDGFNVNSQGTILSVNIKGAEQPYPAEFVTLHYTPKRLGAYHDETILAAAINTAQDVDDILALEKDCVKDASSKKDIIETPTGQLDAESLRLLRYAQPGAGQPALFNLPKDDVAHDDYYRVRLGAQPVILKKGHKYTPYEPKRPGSAWQGFMDFLASTICLQTGWPPSVILPILLSGTDVRRDLDIAQRVADPIQMDMALEFDEIVDHLLQDEIADGELRKDLPDDYFVRAWMFPPKINVDRQQAKEDREDVARGLMTLEEYHGRYATDSVEVDETMIQEAKTRREKIIAAGFKDEKGKADVKGFVEILSLDCRMFLGSDKPDENKKDKKKDEEAA
jgi:hypothetical protein